MPSLSFMMDGLLATLIPLCSRRFITPARRIESPGSRQWRLTAVWSPPGKLDVKEFPKMTKGDNFAILIQRDYKLR